MRVAGLLMLALAAALAASPAVAQGELGDILPGPIRAAVGDLAALREIDAIDQLVADVKTACKALKSYDRPALHAFYQGMMTAQEEAAKRALFAQEDQALYYERRRAEYVRYYVTATTPCVLQRIDELNAPEPAITAKPPAAGAAKAPALTAAAKPPATPLSPAAAKPPANPSVEIASAVPAPSAAAEAVATKPPAPTPAAPVETSPPAPAKPAAAKPPASPPPTPSETAASPPPAAAPSAPAPAAAKALPEKPSVAAANPPPVPTETSAPPAPAAPAEVATAPASLPAAAPAAPEATAAQPNAEPAAEPLPDNITVTDYNVKNGTAIIVLSKIKDNIYEGTWDKGGFKSRMTVSVFVPNRLVMRRQDFGGDGVGKGMTYAGKRAGNRVDATGYKFPDPLGLGTWEARW